MQSYFRDGEARAMTLGNRGPIRFTDEGRLHPEILAAYNRVGFYVFENVLGHDVARSTAGDWLKREPI